MSKFGKRVYIPETFFFLLKVNAMKTYTYG